MIEYLIRRIDGEDHGDWPTNRDRNPDLLRPNTLPSEAVSGSGHHRIMVAGVEVSFAWEPVGLQVAFEGDLAQETAARIVNEVADNLAAASKRPSGFHPDRRVGVSTPIDQPLA